VLFSCDLKKINDYGKSQARILLITNKRVYNLAGKKIKRAIKVSEITAMTKNTAEKNLEFIIHVSSESDYRFKVESKQKRDDIFVLLKESFASITQKNLPVYKVTETDLKEYHTVKSDVKKGICKVILNSLNN
jgi:hypothetical protein